MRVAISLRAVDDDWPAASTYVVEAERLGVDFVWSYESWGHDAATPLAFIAARTSRIRLGTGIMQAGTRTPALVAMTAMTSSVPVGRSLLSRARRERTAGHRGLARHSIRAAGAAAPRNGRHRPPRDPRRARQRQGGRVRAAAAGRRGQGVALRRTCPPEHSGLSRDAVAAQSRDDGRARGRMARNVVHAGARARVLRPDRRGRRPRGPIACRARSPGRWGGRVLRRRRPRRRVAQAGTRVHARRDGVTPAQLL
ncbi:MAG: LLM class flavin-dependent oxidoreductase [Candidatus Rokubacteria bacterium]|nr:LLM class flavin-dependent oxidoreductase [Candidatus Rokubacteria bacterium]